LIITDDPVFARDLVSRWQSERSVPELTVMSTELLTRAVDAPFDLAVIGPLRPARMAAVLKSVDHGARPVICVCESAAEAQQARTANPRILAMQQHADWLDVFLLLAEESLKRVDLAERVRKAEQAAVAEARTAALGRYMLDARHDFNNSLTSVLGNAELLMQDGAALPALVRDQLETIHSMALHMHEVMQRFSSVAAEQQIDEKKVDVRKPDEKKSQDETHRLSHAAVDS
jgi:signal transduction histidine kinase